MPKLHVPQTLLGDPAQARGNRFLELATSNQRAYQRDPARWAKERLGVDLWSKQREIMASVRDHNNTAVHSCHEIGKSFTAAVAVCWWLDTHDPGTAFVFTTAPTAPQVEAVLWREINKLHARAGLPGRLNLTEWYMGRELVAIGRKPSDHNHHAGQGLHAQYFLVVIDEACGVVKSLWDMASTLAANEHSRTLAIGNPDDPQGEFADNCKPTSGWSVIGVSCYDTPNFTGEVVAPNVADSLIHPKWVEGRKRKWGEESALFQSKCLGKFPTVGNPFQTVPWSWAVKCRYTDVPGDGLVEAGVDVGGGNDRTVVTLRQGRRVLAEHDFLDADPVRTVARVAQFFRENDVRKAKVDTIGIGWGIYGGLKDLSSIHNQLGDHTHDAEVLPVNFGASPPPGFEKKFMNMRAYAHWQIGREYSRLGVWNLEKCSDDTINELCASLYEIMDSHGKIKIERKDKVKERIGVSPDMSDALLLAFLDMNWTAGVPDMSLMGQDLLANVGASDMLEQGPAAVAYDNRWSMMTEIF